MRVVAFTGMPGAGKSEAVDVARELGLPVVRMGDFVWDETRRRGLELKDTNVGQVASKMRIEHGKDVWAHRTCDAVLRDYTGATVVVVDGVRNQEEVDAFRARLGDTFELVAITASPRSRQDRLMRRGRPDDPSKTDEFQQRDERELGWGIARSIALAQHVVVNEGDLGAFRNRVKILLDALVADA